MQHSDATTTAPAEQFAAAPLLARPRVELLAEMLYQRLENDRQPQRVMPLPAGVARDLRPHLPNASNLALGAYLNRKMVNSYPLLFTTLAMANPN